MTTFAADAASVGALAHTVTALGDELGAMDGADLTAGLPVGHTQGAVEDLLLNWRHERLSLARGLIGLGDRLAATAHAYATAEEQTVCALSGPRGQR